jgi:hypothetical protein
VSIDDAVDDGPASDGSAATSRTRGVEPVIDDVAAAAAVDTGPQRRRDLTMVRRIAIVAWVVFMIYEFVAYGLAFDRTRLIILLCLGMLAASIGRRKAISVIID